MGAGANAELGDPYPLDPPTNIRFEVMRMRWLNLTFVHWPFDPSEIQELLPEGLTVDTWGSKAWVGLIPFQMEVKTPGGIPIPREGYFPETNVRTYVTGPDGTPGVWFMSLEAGRLLATTAARFTYGLPYFWSKMSVEKNQNTWSYESTRRWPGPKGVRSKVAVTVDASAAPIEQSELDRFLTARWRLYSTFRKTLLYAPVSHEPWQLENAELNELNDELIGAAGLQIPDIDPIVHWTQGVEVRIGRPRKA